MYHSKHGQSTASLVMPCAIISSTPVYSPMVSPPCLEWQLELSGHYGNALAPPTITFEHLLWGLFSNCALGVVVDRRSKGNKHESVNQWFRRDSVDDSNDQLFIRCSFFVLQLSMLFPCRCSFHGLQNYPLYNNGRMMQKNNKICIYKNASHNH